MLFLSFGQFFFRMRGKRIFRVFTHHTKKFFFGHTRMLFSRGLIQTQVIFALDLSSQLKGYERVFQFVFGEILRVFFKFNIKSFILKAI